MEYKATDHFNPTWQVWPRQHQSREQAMGQDALPTTHPIQQVIHDESEANSAFDGISYQKGEQIIRMIEDWIGPDVFRSGMRTYMKAHQYSNSTSADLWAALGAASHRDVAPCRRRVHRAAGHSAGACRAQLFGRTGAGDADAGSLSRSMIRTPKALTWDHSGHAGRGRVPPLSA